MGEGAGKQQWREAAERIEQGIERYAAGDVAASVREFEEALARVPDHPRALACLAWVRDLQAGKRAIGPRPGHIDDEALQAVTDALSDGPGFDDSEETTDKKKRAEMEAEAPESPWDPVPLTPEPRTFDVPAEAAPPPAEPSPPPAAPRPAVSLQELARSGSDTSRKPGATLLGVGDFAGPLLTPTPRPSPLFYKDENTGAQTREFRSSGTNPNLPPLDVPELTDEQLSELAAIDKAKQPELEVGAVVEMEAEPTPVPTRNPLLAKGETTPDAMLDPVRFPSGEFDTLDQTPTRDRGALLRAVAEYDAAPAPPEDELQLPPLESSRDFAEESGTNPTNPFIQRRTHEVAPDDLPPAPGRADTRETPALDPPAPIQEALERADTIAAMDAAEVFVSEKGGLDAPLVKKQHWLLQNVYELLIGPLDRVPKHGHVTPDLDPRSAFMLSRLDGMSSADDLLDVSGMPRLEALRTLALLVRRGIVVMK